MPRKPESGTEHAKFFRAGRALPQRGCLAALLMVCCLGGGCAGPAPSAQFVEQAQRLHAGALAAAVTTDADLREYVQLVGKRVGDAARALDPGRTRDPLFANIEYHLVACAVPNTVTTGGSHVYVYNGLFQACESEDELAAAIAHAVAHSVNLDLEHVDIRPDPNIPLPLVAWQFVTHRYSTAQEQAADHLAMEIYLKAGYDPRRSAALWQHLNDRYPGVQAPDRTPMIIRIQEAARATPGAGQGGRPLPVADPRTFTALRRQASSLNPEQVPPPSQLILRALPNCILSGDAPEQQAAQQQLQPPPPPRRLEPS